MSHLLPKRLAPAGPASVGPADDLPPGMAPTQPARKLWLVWTVPGLISALQYSILCPYTPSAAPETLARAFVGSLLIWYGWAVLTPLVWRLSQRFPVERPLFWRNLGLHGLFVVPVVLAHTALATVCCHWIFRDQDWSTAHLGVIYHEQLIGRLLLELTIYAAVLGGSYLWRTDRRLRDREKRLAEVERELARAQLHALRAQLQPHFLFNTLNSVAVLARSGESEAAAAMLGDLGELLRRSLTHGAMPGEGGHAANPLVSLREELEFSERYLHIERVRFGPERLRVRRSVAPETLEARVPGFLLQPLVENAVRHGVTQRESDGGEVELRAWKEGERLHLEVRDNGPGLSAPAPDAAVASRAEPGRSKEGHGVGLANVRERLRRLYRAGEHAFTCENAAGGRGACVHLVLPFQTTAA